MFTKCVSVENNNTSISYQRENDNLRYPADQRKLVNVDLLFKIKFCQRRCMFDIICMCQIRCMCQKICVCLLKWWNEGHTEKECSGFYLIHYIPTLFTIYLLSNIWLSHWLLEYPQNASLINTQFEITTNISMSLQ